MEQINQKRAEKTEASLKMLEEGLAAKAIEPGQFNDCSYWLKNAYDDEQCSFGDKIAEGIEPHQERYHYRSLLPYSMTHCAGRLKKLAKAKTYVIPGLSKVYHYNSDGLILKIPEQKRNEIVAFFEKWSKISDKLAKLKTMKQKKVSKKETEAEERKRYLAPMQSSANMQKVRDLLEKIVSKQYEKLKTWSFQNHELMFNGLVSAIAEAKTYDEIRKVMRHYPDWHHFYESIWKNDGKEKAVPKAGIQKTIKMLADRYAEEVREHFIYKNMKKLAAILAGKEAKGIKVVEGVVVEGEFTRAFEGQIKFRFADETSFHVRNKIVLKYLPSCGQFAQYPTTFHLVKFADTMKSIAMMVPEQEMVEKWAKE